MNRSMKYPKTMKKMAGLGLAVVMAASLKAQPGKLALHDEFVDKNFTEPATQYHTFIQRVTEGGFPRNDATADDAQGTAKRNSRTSGSYPGTLLYLCEYPQDAKQLKEAEKRLQLLEKEKNNTGTHDL